MFGHLIQYIIYLFSLLSIGGGPSAGLVVGILLAVLFIIVAVTILSVYLYQKRNKDKAALAEMNLGVNSMSFSNVLYQSKSEALGVEMETKQQTSTPPADDTEA